MKKLQYIFLTCLLSIGLVQAQDPQLSQFYASPLYLNPAFAGSSLSPRLIANYRNQWSAIGSSLGTAVFSADLYSDRFNSGFGVLLMNDTQGLGRFQTNNASALYSYQLKLSDNTFLRAGFQGGMGMMGLDNNLGTFGDQYNNDGFIQGSISADQPTNSSQKIYMDLSSGLLLYSSRFWFGGAVHHVNQPEVAMLDNNLYKLPMKISGQAGLNIPLNGFGNGLGHNLEREASISPTILYKQQGKSQQLDAGLYFTYTPLTVGAWYRGIPIQKTNGIPKQDAAIFLIGLRQDAFSVGYSYDVTISKLGPATGGSHEISFAYQFDPLPTKDRGYLKRRKKELSCPKF